MPKTLVATHRLLAGLLGLFIVSHLAVHLTALGGPENHIGWMDAARVLYKNPVVEPLLAAAVLLQVAIGIRLVRRRLRQEKKQFWSWVQILSGFYLAFFLLLHTSAALITKYVVGLDTNFYWAAGTVNINPIKYFFMPYYVLGISSVFAHLAAAVYFGWPDKGRKVAPVIAIFGFGLAVFIVSIFAGAFYEVNVESRYIDYFQKYIPG